MDADPRLRRLMNRTVGDLLPLTTAAGLLVVEDNADEVELFREAMREVDGSLPVTIAPTIADALKWLAQTEEGCLPRLVLTDHHLPDGMGHDMIAALRANPRWVRLLVVMVSGDATRPAGLEGTVWYGKPDSWKGWRELAKLLLERHLPKS